MSGEITTDSHRTASSAVSRIAQLLERSRTSGPMRQAHLSFLLAITSAVADATVDAMLRDPNHAEANSCIAFEAIWRMVTYPDPTQPKA